MSMPKRRQSAIGRHGNNISGDIQTIDHKQHEVVSSEGFVGQAPMMNPMVALRSQNERTSTEPGVSGRERSSTLDTGVDLNELAASLHQIAPPSPALATYPTIVPEKEGSTVRSVSVSDDTLFGVRMSDAASEGSTPASIVVRSELRTNAFGHVRFAESTSKYVKVQEGEEATVIRDFLLQGVWQLDEPNLIISVTGGAQALEAPKALKDKFKDEISKAAQVGELQAASVASADCVVQ
jgi:hypothetical protein